MINAGNYTPIMDEILVTDFIQYLHKLDLGCISYIAFGIQDTINCNSVSLMSNTDWQEIYKNEELSKYDPIRIAAFKTALPFFCFSDIGVLDNAGRYVMQQRRAHQITNGVVLVDRKLNKNYMLTLGTDYRYFDGHKFIIENHKAVLNTMHELKQLISKNLSFQQFMNDKSFKY